MVRDTALTRRRLLEAAGAEFSAEGLAGARVDRIAQRAGVNKERIYSYFGSKDGLFDAVVAEELGQVVADVPIRGEGPEAVGAYAADLLDHASDHPRLARLMGWEGLVRGGDVAHLLERQQHCLRKIEMLQLALPGSTRESAAELLLTIITLADAWAILPQLARLMLGEGADRRERRRSAVAEMVTLLAVRAMSNA